MDPINGIANRSECPPCLETLPFIEDRQPCVDEYRSENPGGALLKLCSSDNDLEITVAPDEEIIWQGPEGILPDCTLFDGGLNCHQEPPEEDQEPHIGPLPFVPAPHDLLERKKEIEPVKE